MARTFNQIITPYIALPKNFTFSSPVLHYNEKNKAFFNVSLNDFDTDVHGIQKFHNVWTLKYTSRQEFAGGLFRSSRLFISKDQRNQLTRAEESKPLLSASLSVITSHVASTCLGMVGVDGSGFESATRHERLLKRFQMDMNFE